jgi:hypothetical protein
VRYFVRAAISGPPFLDCDSCAQMEILSTAYQVVTQGRPAMRPTAPKALETAARSPASFRHRSINRNSAPVSSTAGAPRR